MRLQGRHVTSLAALQLGTGLPGHLSYAAYNVCCYAFCSYLSSVCQLVKRFCLRIVRISVAV